MTREVVYQEAGVTRQRFVQRRVSAVMQEKEARHLQAVLPGLVVKRAEEGGMRELVGG